MTDDEFGEATQRLRAWFAGSPSGGPMVKSRKRINPRKIPTPKTPRPRQPTDLTLRNLRAAKKRLDLMQMELDALGARVTNLEQALPPPAPETD